LEVIRDTNITHLEDWLTKNLYSIIGTRNGKWRLNRVKLGGNLGELRGLETRRDLKEVYQDFFNWIGGLPRD